MNARKNKSSRKDADVPEEEAGQRKALGRNVGLKDDVSKVLRSKRTIEGKTQLTNESNQQNVTSPTFSMPLSEVDCKKQNRHFPSHPQHESELVDYLAKDYASFRHTLLEQIQRRYPQWIDQSEADLGMILIELFSYVADELSYYQDRIANEAYLSTARKRVSVKSHLELIDYLMHNGLAANAFIRITAKKAGFIRKGFPISSSMKTRLSERNTDDIVFEVNESKFVDPKYNEIPLLLSGVLKRPTTSALLAGTFSKLRKGHYVLFEQGIAKEIVRLSTDPILVNGNTLISWSKNDDLKFQYDSHARVSGNILKATHGKTVKEIIKKKDQYVMKFAFTLHRAPLTFVSDNGSLSDSHSTLEVMVDGELWQETNNLSLCGPLDQKYSISSDDEGYVTVFFGDGVNGMTPPDDSLIIAKYRVGVGTYGNVGEDILTEFDNSLNESRQLVEKLTNPFAAFGGIDIESIEDAKISGPKSLKFQERAITAADYEELILRRFPNVSNAKARFSSNRGRDSVIVSVDMKGETDFDPAFLNEIKSYLDNVKMIGYQIRVESAKYVPLVIGLQVYIYREHDSPQLRERITMAFSSNDNPNGSRGFFHPDNFTFGDHVFVSKIYEVLENISEVKYAIISEFRRVASMKGASSPSSGLLYASGSTLSQFPIASMEKKIGGIMRDVDTIKNLRQGYIRIDEGEIAMVENIPAHLERGVVKIEFYNEE